MEGIRERLNLSGNLGKGVMLAAVIAMLALAIWMLRDTFGRSPAARMSSERMYVCKETGKSFTYKPGENELYPVMYSGKKTGYPGEACYWTKDGKIKQEPTWVLRNSFKGVKGATFCPDCNHWMDPNAAPPAAGMPPPPTREEYAKRRPTAWKARRGRKTGVPRHPATAQRSTRSARPRARSTSGAAAKVSAATDRSCA